MAKEEEVELTNLAPPAEVAPSSGKKGGGGGAERPDDIDLADEKMVVTPYPPAPVKNKATLFFHQLYVMVKKNTILLYIRYWKSALAQLIIPIFMMLILFLLQFGFKVAQPLPILHPESYDLEHVYSCTGNNDGPCINLMFTPNTPEVRDIIEIFVVNNKKRGGEDWEVATALFTSMDAPEEMYGVIPVANANFIYDYVYKNPNVTQYGVVFDISATNYNYQVWYNSSLTTNSTFEDQQHPYGTQLLSIIRGLDEAIVEHASVDISVSPQVFNVHLKDWPTQESGVAEMVIISGGPIFFYACTIINFLMIIYMMLGEKETKLRQSMEMMGLMPSVYWISWIIVNIPMTAIVSVVTVAFGYVFDFSMFSNTQFAVLFLMFFLHGVAMMFVAFFFVTISPQVRSGVLAGLFFVIIALAFMLVVFSNPFIGYIWWSDITTPPVGWAILLFFPFFNFGKLLMDISTLSTGVFDRTTSIVILGPGFRWDDLYNIIPAEYQPPGNYEFTPPVYALNFFWIDMLFWGLLTWYCDNVFPDPFGNREPFYFFLLPSYWGFHRETDSQMKYHEEKRAEAPNVEEDDDVNKERIRALDDSLSAEKPIRLMSLRKVYEPLFGKSNKKVAVNASSWTVGEGQLLALLGQNGAGKSTTINILCGFNKQTAGDAYLNGYNIRTQMAPIRTILGVCPQHDILFPDLTAYEHLELFAGIKNIPKENIPKLIEERLNAVRLWRVRNKRAGTYSGGMKRRLSVAISTIGDPKILFLDEPTTGMDPVNRRYVWKFIEHFKQGRAIILTTHSMEEADILGDSIAIMALGNLIAFGNSIRLKNKFGSGYRFSAVCNEKDIDEVKQVVTKIIPDATVEDDSAGAMVFNIPPKSSNLIPELIRSLKDYPELVREWGLSQTTLEDTFLRLIRSVNPTKQTPAEKHKKK